MYSVTGYQARIYDILRALDKMAKATKDKLMNQTAELHALVEDLTGKIDTLKKECLADCVATKFAIEAKKEELIEKINWWDAEHIAGGYLRG